MPPGRSCNLWIKWIALCLSLFGHHGSNLQCLSVYISDLPEHLRYTADELPKSAKVAIVIHQDKAVCRRLDSPQSYLDAVKLVSGIACIRCPSMPIWNAHFQTLHGQHCPVPIMNCERKEPMLTPRDFEIKLRSPGLFCLYKNDVYMKLCGFTPSTICRRM